MNRANYLPAPHFFNLHQACRVVYDAFGSPPYLVGSSLERRDYRDVDVRLILEDAEFDRLFPGTAGSAYQLDALWSLLNSSIALYLSQHSGLPVDFQIQRMTEANLEYPGARGRQPLGIFFHRKPAPAEEKAQ